VEGLFIIIEFQIGHAVSLAYFDKNWIGRNSFRCLVIPQFTKTLLLSTPLFIRSRDKNLLHAMILSSQGTLATNSAITMATTKNIQNEHDVDNISEKYVDDYIIEQLLPYVEPPIGRMILFLPQDDDTMNDNNTSSTSCSSRFSLLVNQTNESSSIKIVDNILSKLPSSKAELSLQPLTLVNDMKLLALECDRLVFDNNSNGTAENKNYLGLSKKICGLIKLANEDNGTNMTLRLKSDNKLQKANVYITIAIILALNMLESTILKTVHSKSSQSVKGGGAPLLRHMIEQLASCCDAGKDNDQLVENSFDTLQIILKGLLLPSGLNLRNLLWHGFIGSNIQRPWLSLVIVIMHQLDVLPNTRREHDELSTPKDTAINQSFTGNSENTDTGLHTKQSTFPFLNIKNYHPCFPNVVDQGTRLRIELAKSSIGSSSADHTIINTNGIVTCAVDNDKKGSHDHHKSDVTSLIRSIVPRTHQQLWDYCVYEIYNSAKSLDSSCLGTSVQIIDTEPQLVSEVGTFGRSITISITLTILIEHILRLLYCKLNTSRIHDDTKARFGAYYITLDGHGQQHQHDLLLHPYQLHNIHVHNDTTSHQCIGHDSSLSLTDYKDEDIHNNSSKRSQLTSKTTRQRNRLIDLLGGNAVSLLTDLFVSGTGGPNLRAAMAHGLWDDCIQNEIESMLAINNKSRSRNNNAWEVVDVLLATIGQITVALQDYKQNEVPLSVIPYRPLFSFTASTLESLQNHFSVLVDFRNLLNILEVDMICIKSVPESVSSRTLCVLNEDQLRALLQKVLGHLSFNSNAYVGKEAKTVSQRQWSIDDTYAEYEMNKILEPLGATRQLLVDTRVAVKALNDNLSKGYEIQKRQKDQLDPRCESTRQRNRMRRLVFCSKFAVDLYSFAYIVAILSIQNGLSRSDVVTSTFAINNCLNDKEWIRIVERTRMVVSTFSNFLTCNIDRSFKAADQYIRGKLVQKIIHEIRAQKCESNDEWTI
jgi:Domain of unknown function (DUF4209)